MTDRTHPDSGFPIAYSHYATYAEYVEALHARIAELEAQLESIGACGVSGPLVGQPQAVPDLSQLTERGAVAWAGVDAQGLREGAASAGSEPVAPDGWLHENGLLYRLADERHPCNRDEINVTMADGSRSIESRSRRALELLDRIRTNHPSPPEGMVGGWTKASQQLPPCRDDQLYLGVNTAGFAGVFNAVAKIAGDVYCMYETPEETIDVMSSLDIWQPFTPPTASAGSGKGE